jgi:pyruvate,orthophosphate dikinase
VGLAYVSCSPFRVPVARLAAAKAAVELGTVPKGGRKAAKAAKPAKSGGKAKPAKGKKAKKAKGGARR